MLDVVVSTDMMGSSELSRFVLRDGDMIDETDDGVLEKISDQVRAGSARLVLEGNRLPFTNSVGVRPAMRRNSEFMCG